MFPDDDDDDVIFTVKSELMDVYTPSQSTKTYFFFFNSSWALKKMLLHGSNFSVLTY